MELARFIFDEERPLPEGERIYAGHPGCGAWLDQPAWIAGLDRPFTLAVPPLSEPRFRQFAGWLRDLAAYGRSPDIELAPNDWGTLNYCHDFIQEQSLPWQLAAGVLLAEQHTDPLLAQFCCPTERRSPVWSGDERAELAWSPPPPELTEHWRWPGIFGKTALLGRLGVSRLELCGQPLPWPEQGPGLPVSIYGPALLSVIPCAACSSQGDAGLSYAAACAACSVAVALGQRGGRTLRRARNVLWYEQDSPPPGWADRLVYW